MTSIPLGEHARRGLGVDPDVELGRRRDVAFSDRAAHEDDPLDVEVRVAGERQRDVGERAGRDQRDRTARCADPGGEEVDRVLGDGRPGGRREVGPVEPGLPVHVLCHLRVADQRAVGTGGDRNVAAAGELEHAQRVGGRLVERLVAVDGGDPEQLELRARERQQQRHRVVVPGVAVDQHRRGHLGGSL